MAQIGLMALTAFLILWLAAKVYRAGAVHGAGMSDAMNWIKGFLPGKENQAEAADP
jgi:ABC-2 type transport system permease protein